MKKNKYLTWHRVRQAQAEVAGHVMNGGSAIIVNSLKAITINAKNISVLEAGQDDLYIRLGKKRLALGFVFGGCKIWKV